MTGKTKIKYAELYHCEVCNWSVADYSVSNHEKAFKHCYSIATDEQKRYLMKQYKQQQNRKKKAILTRIDKTQENKFAIPNTTKTFSVIEQQWTDYL